MTSSQISFCFLLLVILAGPAPAQDEPITQTDKQAAALIDEQNRLADEYNAIIRKIKASAPIVKLDEAITAAAKGLADAENADEAAQAARKALASAQADVKAAVEKKLVDHSEAGEIQEKIAKARSEIVEHHWQAALAQFSLDHPLSPVGRVLAGDKEVIEAKRAVDNAAPGDRAAARVELEKLRREKIAELEPGKELLAAIEEATAAGDRLQQSIVSLEDRLLPIRREIEAAEKKVLADAQTAVDTALASEPLKQLRLARNDAVKAYNAAVNEAIAADAKAGDLKKQYEAVAAKVKELRSKSKK